MALWVLFPSWGWAAEDCLPAWDDTLPQYIVGYGSLLNEQSKRRDVPDAGDNWPVLVHGFERLWGKRAQLPKVNMVFLSAWIKPESHFNAVVFSLKRATDILAFDRRERHYCRFNLPLDQLTFLTQEAPTAGQFWMYYSKEKPEGPDQAYRLLQSYVDIFLSGCLDMGQKFDLQDYARSCLETTGLWSLYRWNDRANPIRADVPRDRYAEIDALLQKYPVNLIEKENVNLKTSRRQYEND